MCDCACVSAAAAAGNDDDDDDDDVVLMPSCRQCRHLASSCAFHQRAVIYNNIETTAAVFDFHCLQLSGTM